MSKSRHTVTFLNAPEIETVVLAQLGGSTKLIQASTGLTACQVSYRLTKAKKGEGLPNGEGYRTQWRNGTSQYYAQVAMTVLPAMRAWVKKVLPSKFISVPAAQQPSGKPL